jgi:ubiquinone/menaquinone biosynthesis C-methylase UbiE
MTQPAYAMNQPNFAELYERWLVGPLFRPWAELLIERVGVSPGDRLLDLACGTGIVARLARERLGETGRVVGVDLSPLMLAVARTAGPGIEWREGNAGSLPFAESEFDVVLCQQGLQFFPDKAAALAEMRRVLAPGGRLGVATWRPLDEVPGFLTLHRVAERHLGPVTDQRHSFGESAALQGVLSAAGFKDVSLETRSLPVHFEDPPAFVRLNSMALVGMSPGSKAMADEERIRLAGVIAAESAVALQPFADGTGITFQLKANLAVARR